MKTRLISGLTGLLLPVLPALAQTYELASPRVREQDSVLIEWIIVAVFVVGTLAVAFKPAPRSNLQ
jgi:hypothetical protein